MKKKLDKNEKRLLQAETEISELKNFLFKISGLNVLHNFLIDGKNAAETRIQLRDRDYNDIPVHEWRHHPTKKPKPGCLCFRCNEIRNRQ